MNSCSKIFLALILWITFPAWAELPILVDLTLVGTSDNAYFEPKKVDLSEGGTYLMVIENPHPVPYQFVSKDLAEGIVTQSIQGSGSVTRGSVAIGPKTKIQWSFRAKKAGEYSFYAESHGHQRAKMLPGVIIISSASVLPQTKSMVSATSDPTESIQKLAQVDPLWTADYQSSQINPLSRH